MKPSDALSSWLQSRPIVEMQKCDANLPKQPSSVRVRAQMRGR